ncbi:MAG: hypothetical protein AB7D20_02385 [Sulfuricurvum sp.]|uniref:hypothetical protein n=1 Tax=Sulfuricurvum sp. TaxID=2025608 RepID=UPI003D0AE78D
MTKGLKYGALSVIASALLSTSAFAYTLTDYAGNAIGVVSHNTAQTKASELSTSAAIANIDLGDYTPNDIALTTLSNPTFNYAVQNGHLTLDLVGKFYYIVESTTTTAGIPDITNATDKVVAKYTAGSGTSTLAFGATGPQVSNGGKYVIVQSEDDVTMDASTTVAAITATVPLTRQGISYAQTTAATTDKVVVNLGQGDSQSVSDVAIATILTASKQLCGTIVGVSKSIDPLDDFKSFNLQGVACGANNQDTQDTVYAIVHASDYDIDAVSAASDDVTVTVVSDKPLPAGTTASIATVASSTNIGGALREALGGTPSACTITTTATNSTVSCPLVNVDGVNLLAATAHGFTGSAAAVTFTVDGNHAIERTHFTASIAYDFNNAGATDYTGSNLLVADLDANTWNYNGAVVTIPSINANADTNTQVKLNNNSDQNARVFWNLSDDAGNVASMIEVAAVSGNTGLAAGVSDTWLASTLKAAAAANGIGDKFRAEAVVTATEGVDGVTVMMINGGRDRVIPTTIDNATGADFVR